MERLLLHAVNPQQKKTVWKCLHVFMEKFKICEGVGCRKRCKRRKEESQRILIPAYNPFKVEAEKALRNNNEVNVEEFQVSEKNDEHAIH
jgi:hypothetical protein